MWKVKNLKNQINGPNMSIWGWNEVLHAKKVILKFFYAFNGQIVIFMKNAENGLKI